MPTGRPYFGSGTVFVRGIFLQLAREGCLTVDGVRSCGRGGFARWGWGDVALAGPGPQQLCHLVARFDVAGACREFEDLARIERIREPDRRGVGGRELGGGGRGWGSCLVSGRRDGGRRGDGRSRARVGCAGRGPIKDSHGRHESDGRRRSQAPTEWLMQSELRKWLWLLKCLPVMKRLFSRKWLLLLKRLSLRTWLFQLTRPLRLMTRPLLLTWRSRRRGGPWRHLIGDRLR